MFFELLLQQYTLPVYIVFRKQIVQWAHNVYQLLLAYMQITLRGSYVKMTR